VTGTIFGNDGAWTPKVAVQNKHGSSDGPAPRVAVQNKYGSGNGPAEEDFTLSTDAFAGGDVMGTVLNPIDNVLVAARPAEAHVNVE
jgi:hypothetical protein